MMPRPFGYVAPTSLDEAVAEVGMVPGTRVLAGGMSLVPMMKLRVLTPARIVDISRIDALGTISASDDLIEFGATVRQYQVAKDAVLARRGTALAEAASWTGDPQVRNHGTLCGSLAHADPSADQPAAVLALGGAVNLRSLSGQRTVTAEDFFVDAFETAVEPGEILTSVTVPLAKEGEGSAYEKLGRRGGRSGFAIAASAAWVKLKGGMVTNARVALTAVSTRPVLTQAVATALIGTDGSPEAIRMAATRATDGTTVIPDLHGSVDYKSHLAVVLTGRALETAVSRAKQNRSSERNGNRPKRP